MSNDEKKLLQPVAEPLAMRELAAVLVRHYGLTEGLYTLLVEFNVGVGPVGPNKDNLSPGAMIGVSKIGLIAAAEPGPSTVDAAEANPKKSTRKTASKSKS
jgi:hypothetical protein